MERLAAVGKWMSVNGDAIYGTTASPSGRAALLRSRHAEALSALRARSSGCRSNPAPLTLPAWGTTPKKAWLVATKAAVPLKRPMPLASL